MAELRCDVLILGGGAGGCAAALRACANGLHVILTEETDWIGGQLTSQAVPPDEHPWIERFGAPRDYMKFRLDVRIMHLQALPYGEDKELNPGGGWVSRLCHLPKMGHQVMRALLRPHLENGKLDLRTRTILAGGSQLSGPPVESKPALTMHQDSIESVAIQNLGTGEIDHVSALYYIDATELGDLLPLCGAEYVSGAESRRRTHEFHGAERDDPNNQQALTWVFAMAHDPGSNRTIDKPEGYERWGSFKPDFWPGPLLGLADIDPISGERREMPIFSDDWRCWFKYRQIYDPARPPRLKEFQYPHPITIVNWPQNDYFLAPIVDATPEESWTRLQDARELSQCALYWLQTECGYPGLYAVPEVLGTPDGFAKTPYIRESRRIVARRTVTEEDVSANVNFGSKVAPAMPDSVGIGYYRIDLHPSTGGDNYLDLASLPFQIPLGSMVPVRIKNLIPACKNIGTTHITNGCYRLHPVEWTIGAVAGTLAAFCIGWKTTPAQLLERGQLEEFQKRLRADGIELEWPADLLQ